MLYIDIGFQLKYLILKFAVLQIRMLKKLWNDLTDYWNKLQLLRRADILPSFKFADAPRIANVRRLTSFMTIAIVDYMILVLKFYDPCLEVSFLTD